MHRVDARLRPCGTRHIKKILFSAYLVVVTKKNFSFFDKFNTAQKMRDKTLHAYGSFIWYCMHLMMLWDIPSIGFCCFSVTALVLTLLHSFSANYILLV